MSHPAPRVLVIVMLAFLGLAGCASTQELDAVRADAKAANDRAVAAETAAAKAQASADAASAAAARAEQAAREAMAAAKATDEKIDRMFKQTMNK